MNAAKTIAQKDGISLKEDENGLALFIPQSDEIVKLREIADSFGLKRHELGAPEIDSKHNGILIPVCPRVQYSCENESMAWSEALEEGFGPTCPEHGGAIQFVYEQEQIAEGES